MKTILEMDDSEIIELIQSKKLSICVIGIGRIGLPTALSFANSGLTTIGVDINEKLIETINSGIFPLNDEPGYDEIFEKVLNEKKFRVTNNFSEGVNDSDVIILSLPTPMDSQNIPDYSALLSVAKKLHDEMTDGKLIIIESTVEPGFVEKDFLELLESDDRLVGENFCLGVCPETANPGEIMVDFEKLPRLVGGINEKSKNIISELYKHVFPVQLIPMPDCKTANAVKLTTNVFRDVNIAFINELSILFEKLGIDTNVVLEAAKTKYNFQVHYPGAGVGGPCLPINSYQFLNSGKKFDENLLTIIKASRSRNENMPSYVVEMISDLFSKNNKSLKNSSLLILGISYKPNVKDIQLSPAEIIIKKLQENGSNIRIFDPYFKSTTVFGIKTEDNFESILSQVDGIVILTAHKEFLDIDPFLLKSKLKYPIVIDTRGIIDVLAAKESGLIFRSLGRKL